MFMAALITSDDNLLLFISNQVLTLPFALGFRQRQLIPICPCPTLCTL
jgi:hypothetical protein